MLSKPKQNLSEDSSSRTGWTPVVCKKDNYLQIRIACQRSNGSKNLYSSSPSAAKSRPTWAPIFDCEVVCEVNSKSEAKQKQVFSFNNCENETKTFSAVLLYPLIYPNPFNQKCAQFVSENRLKLLGYYYSLTSKAEGYITHTDQFDKNGFSADGSGLQVKDIIDADGSLEELQTFQKLAEENAFVFGSDPGNDKDFRLSSLNKRKITDFFDKQANPQNKEKKMTKTERVETNFREEMESEVGLEKSFVNSYVIFKYVHIDRLSVSPKLFLKLNDAKVRDLIESMETQFDPTQIILTVCPADVEKYQTSDKIENLDFLVIVGQHRLEALKALDRHGKLAQLAGIRNRKIPCYVCKADTAAGANYANIRSNDISSKFKSKASNEDLVFIYSGLMKTSQNRSEALDTIKRICHSRQTAPEDISSLIKITEWPEDKLEKMIMTLESFQKFLTLDATGYGAKAKLKKREAKTLTKAQFRQLGRCKPDFFDANYERVTRNEISMKDLLIESEKSIALDKTVCTISQAAGNEDFKALKEKYPNRFDDDSIQKFVGAEVFGRKKNEQGLLLKNYVKRVKEGRDLKESIKLEEINSVFDVNGTKLESYDVIIYNSKTWEEGFVKYLVDYIGCTFKDHISVILILPSERYLPNLMKELESWRNNENFKVSQILFEKGTSVAQTGIVQENITFSVLFGKVNIFQGELFSLTHGTIESELQKVVEKVSPPSARVAYISGEGSSLIKVHPSVSEKSDCEVTYYSSKKSLEEFVKKFLIQVPVTGDLQENIFNAKSVNEDIGDQNENLADTENVESKKLVAPEDVHSLEKSSSTSSKKYPNSDEDLA